MKNHDWPPKSRRRVAGLRRLSPEQAARRLSRAGVDGKDEALLDWADRLDGALELAIRTRVWMPFAELKERFEKSPDRFIDGPGRPLAEEVSREREELSAPARTLLHKLCAFAAPIGFTEIEEELSVADQLRDRGWLTPCPGGSSDRWRVAAPLRALLLFQLDHHTRQRVFRLHARVILKRAHEPTFDHRNGYADLRAIADRFQQLDPSLSRRAVLALVPRARTEVSTSPMRHLLLRALDTTNAPSSETACDLESSLALRSIDSGSFEDATQWLRSALNHAKRDDQRVNGLSLMAHVLTWLGRLDEARAALEKAQSFGNTNVPPAVWGQYLTQRAHWHIASDSSASPEALADARRHAEIHDLDRLLVINDYLGGRLALRSSAADPRKLERARRLLERAVEGADGDLRMACCATAYLANVLRRLGDQPRAHGCAREALERARALKSDAIVLMLLTELLLCEERDPEIRKQAESLARRTELPTLRTLVTHSAVVRRGLLLRIDSTAHRAWLGRRRLDLQSRGAPRRVFARLCQRDLDLGAGPVSVRELFRAGWPDERVSETSQRKRVQTAIWTLRRMGLADVISHTPGGYRITAPVRYVRAADV